MFTGLLIKKINEIILIMNKIDLNTSIIPNTEIANFNINII